MAKVKIMKKMKRYKTLVKAKIKINAKKFKNIMAKAKIMKR